MKLADALTAATRAEGIAITRPTACDGLRAACDAPDAARHELLTALASAQQKRFSTVPRMEVAR